MQAEATRAGRFCFVQYRFSRVLVFRVTAGLSCVNPPGVRSRESGPETVEDLADIDGGLCGVG